MRPSQDYPPTSDEAPDGKWVGRAVRRFEDQRLLVGAGRYADDLRFAGEAHAVVVRSPHAHAEIVSLDRQAAEGLPGVLAVLTAADLRAAGVGPIPFFATVAGADGRPVEPPPCHALADRIVRHVGEPVALVVAETCEAARDAAERVEVDYRPLAAVTDATQAIDPAAPQLWPAAPGNIVGVYRVGDEAAVERSIAAADHVVRLEVANNRVIAHPMEPRTAIGTFDAATGALTLHCGSQAAHLSRGLLARALQVADEKLRVVVGDVGGGFGAKIVPYREDLLVLFAARHLRRPVRWRCERGEAFLSDTQGRDQAASLTLALDRRGRILAYRAEVLANMGAYLSPFGLPIATTTGHRVISGVYAIPQVFVRVRGVLTNSVPTGPYRGAGRPETIHRLERLIDVAAVELGLDAAEIRRRNLIGPDQMPYRNAAGWTYDSGGFGVLLGRALLLADWEGFPARRARSEARGRLRGRGLACHIDTTSGIDLKERAQLRLDGEGQVELLSGTQAIGQGLATAYAQIVAEQLGLPPDRVRVTQGDTARIPGGGGTYGSRSLYLGGAAARMASETLRQRLLALAAERFGVQPGELRVENGLVLARGSNLSVGFAELAAGQPDRQVGAEALVEAPYCFPNGCYVCEVEIDPDTGSTQVARLTALDDFGRVINPLLVHGQVHGGLAQGIGQALFERALYDPESGQLLTGSLMDYALPRAGDLPAFAVAFDESWPTATNPLGAKGAGESGAVGAPPAVVAAAVDALAGFGVKHLDMPLTPETVWRAIRGLPARG